MNGARVLALTLAGAASVVPALVAPRPAAAHGLFPSEAPLADPATGCMVVDRSVTFHWSDYDKPISTGTATVDFNYIVDNTRTFQRGEHPPDFLAASHPIVHGILEADRTDTWTWNTSTVAAGSYWIWSFVVDPPAEINTVSVIDFAPFPVTIAHPGDPVWPAVSITDPDSPFRFADENFTIKYSGCDPDHSGKIKLEYTLNADGSGLETIADGLPTGDQSFSWDTHCVPAGNAILKATITDGRGLTWSSWGRYVLLITHLTASDAGCVTAVDGGTADTGCVTSGDGDTAEAGCVTTVDGGTADAGGTSPRGKKSCSCQSTATGQVGGDGATSGSSVTPVLLLAAALALRKRGEWSDDDDDLRSAREHRPPGSTGGRGHGPG